MFSCVILRVPESSGHYDLQIYALFSHLCNSPENVAPASLPRRKTYRLRAETPAIQFPYPFPLKKKVLFSRKKSVFAIYLFPPLGIYTQTPPKKAAVKILIIKQLRYGKKNKNFEKEGLLGR